MDRFAALETFVMVVEAGSFSAAAKRLNVGQPAVSKSVAQLEETIGVRLLLRSTRGLTPTDAGQRFYEHAKRALDESSEADQAARGASAGLRGKLRVCAAVTFARIHIVPHLKTFLAAHPEMSIDVVLDDRVVDVMAEGIEVALRMGTLEDSNMMAQRITTGRRVVLGTPAYFEAFGEPATPAELVKHEAVVYGQGGGGTSWEFTRETTQVSVAVAGRVHVTAGEGVRAAVLSDMGVAIASEWMFSPELASGQVRRVLTDWSLPAIDLWAVYPTGRMVSARARAFVDFVKSVLDPDQKDATGTTVAAVRVDL